MSRKKDDTSQPKLEAEDDNGKI
jgi:hypothetical protein